jgi:hypothetical protein
VITQVAEISRNKAKAAWLKIDYKTMLTKTGVPISRGGWRWPARGKRHMKRNGFGRVLGLKGLDLVEKVAAEKGKNFETGEIRQEGRERRWFYRESRFGTRSRSSRSEMFERTRQLVRPNAKSVTDGGYF